MADFSLTYDVRRPGSLDLVWTSNLLREVGVRVYEVLKGGEELSIIYLRCAIYEFIYDNFFDHGKRDTEIRLTKYSII